jgi:hypothetical protein
MMVGAQHPAAEPCPFERAALGRVVSSVNSGTGSSALSMTRPSCG